MSHSAVRSKPGRVYHFERYTPKQLWRHRAHDFLAQAMILSGGALAAYEFVIRPFFLH